MKPSQIYIKYQKYSGEVNIVYLLKELQKDPNESETGKSLILTNYIIENLDQLSKINITIDDIKSILDHGHGWKLKRHFKILIQKLENINESSLYKMLHDYLKLRSKSCYKNLPNKSMHRSRPLL